jgi:hypothetical protein
MISPIDAHDVAEVVSWEAYDAGERIGACSCDLDDFLEAATDLAPYIEAVRWLTGHVTGEISEAAVRAITRTRDTWQGYLDQDIASGALAEDIAHGRRLQATFDRVLDAIGGDA